MKKMLLQTSLVIVTLSLVSYAYNKHYENTYDELYIPYGIKAFDVLVYNEDTDKEFYIGNIITDYSNAQARLSDAQTLAYDFAEMHHLENWSYICCTVTNSSNCVTKVR
jgi:hypothetical protein